MKGLTRIHEWLSSGALANGISEDGLLQIAQEACIAMQDGTLRCWDGNGMPFRKGIPIPEQRRLDPRITDDVGNDWLKAYGYLWSWKHGNDPVFQSSVKLAASPQEPWITQARQLAKEIIDAAYERDLYPNKTSVADRIADKFRKAGIHGTSGKPLSGAYIKRHAMKGIYSRKPQRKHAEIAQGK